ncbi:GDP-L-fucose synthase [Cellulophaga sp. HaHaR_3_176]|uniref:GDP-L-fucose synthase family protein n=1 Tax=Cellulophaga sp. HaHaR_3_176 TaxID=1942464 RepID=UPI001C1FDE1D|nr:GDP-L-fucose synthase [Cellulophaga sp. HaHaR_3_176]QWX83319.1 GDP-L-fucose synthase [Cellulophaga sp. HaHaR_3_176]
MEKNAKIYIAGHRGLVGSAILKNLDTRGYTNFITRTHKELDLTDSNAVAAFFAKEKPEYVFLAAAKVGGIVANNTYRADFIHANLMIQNNVIHQSYVHGVKKMMFLGSTCIYPKNCPQPMKEDYLLTDTLEYTNEPYAIAKIAGIKMCESYNLQYGTNFISVMPTNLYGPNDNFDLEKSHVLPALIRKMHLGKALENRDWDTLRKDLNKLPIEGFNGVSMDEDIYSILDKYGIQKKGDTIHLEIWGSGKPMREFLWSEDMADASVFLMEERDFTDCYSSKTSEIRNTHINIGTGVDISIEELAKLIKKTVGFKGKLYFNSSKPDGTMKKLTDPSKLHGLGWKHKIELKEGVRKMYEWYKA